MAAIADSTRIWVQFRTNGPWHSAHVHWRDPNIITTDCKPSWIYHRNRVTISDTPGPGWCGQVRCARAGIAYRRDKAEAAKVEKREQAAAKETIESHA